MIKLVAFDWNGTILSDTFACYEGDNASLIVHGAKPVTLTQFREYFDIPVINFYKNLGLSEKTILKNVLAGEKAFHSTYDELSKNARTRAGSRDLLIYLEKKSVASVIFSNHILEKIQQQLKRLKIEKYFSHIIANNAHGEAVKRRYKGEALRKYIRKQGLAPKEVMIVGDCVEEIEISKELGTISEALTGGYNITKRLKEKNPDYLIPDLRGIIKIIESLNSKAS